MPVLALGVSYRAAPVELLERLTIPEEQESKSYRRLQGLESIRESVILSTCNRIEVYADVTLYHQGFLDLKRFLTEQSEVPAEQLAEPLYSHYEDDASEHLFAVASGLDSMVLGEPQILAQVRAAFRRADAEGAAGPALADLFRRAVRAGRRVRAETAIGASPAAFVEAGAELAAEHLEGLPGRSVLVIGAGDMGALAVRALRDREVGEVVVLSRRAHRAERLAATIGGQHGSMEEIEAALSGAELVVSSTGSTGSVVHVPMVRRALGGRAGRTFLHARGEAIRAEEVRRIAGRLGTERDRHAVDALTRRIVRRLLHDPVTRLKDRAGRGVGEDSARTLAELFGLEPPE